MNTIKNIIIKIKDNRKIILLICSIILVFSVLVNSTYSLLVRTDETNNISYTTGILEITSNATNNSVTLTNSLPLSDADGLSSTPYTFKITNTGNLTFNFDVKLLSTTTENQISASYIKISVNGNAPVTLSSLTNGIILEDQTLLPGKSVDITLRVWLSINTPNSEIGKSFNAKIVTEGEAVYTNDNLAYATLEKLGLTSSIKDVELPESFTTSSANDSYEDGIYAVQDDLGTSYVFRGNVTNNYVKFGESTTGDDMYWRIVRINGDGTIRLIYDGTQAYENNATEKNNYITNESAYNTSEGDNAYVGYMYGSTGATTYANAHANTNSSNVKQILDSWYLANLHNLYRTYIADAIYCNDRTVNTSSISWNGDTYTINGFGTNNAMYGTANRSALVTSAGNGFISGISPSLLCSQVSDRFTVSSTISGISGNGKLTYPIGLITADEVVYAGGFYYCNSGDCTVSGTELENDETYLFDHEEPFLTMTPFYYNNGATIFAVEKGALKDYSVTRSNVKIRPSISLKSTVTITGTGTATNPFTVVVSDSGYSETPQTYTVSNSLATGITSSNSATSVDGGSSYSATLTNSDTTKSMSVTVTMGGTNITSSAVSTSGNTATISISNVTGDIVITATLSSSSSTTYTVTYNLSSKVVSSNSATSVTEGSSYSATITNSDTSKTLSVTVKMGSSYITSSVVTISGNTATISIPSVTGNVVITATLSSASSGTTYTVTYNLSNVSKTNIETSVTSGSSYTNYLSSPSSTSISYSVTMGGTAITSTVGSCVTSGDSTMSLDGNIRIFAKPIVETVIPGDAIGVQLTCPIGKNVRINISSVTGDIVITASSLGSASSGEFETN